MSDYRFVEQLDDRLRGELMELYQHEWWTNERREDDVARMLRHTDLVVGVCTDPGDRLVGFTRVLTDRAYKAVIFDVIVAEAHRKTGLGRKLIEHVLDHPMLADVRHLELYCRPELIPFYEQWGFTAALPGVNLMRRERRSM